MRRNCRHGKGRMKLVAETRRGATLVEAYWCPICRRRMVFPLRVSYYTPKARAALGVTALVRDDDYNDHGVGA